jgi:Tol biopolymer transport system component
VLTGAVQEIADGWGAEASPDGKQLLLADAQLSEITIAGSQGESPRRFVKAADGDVVASAHWLPGGRRIGYLTGKNGAPDAEIQTRDLSGNDMKRVTRANIESVVFAPDGRVFYATRDTGAQPALSLWTASIDPATGDVTGQPARLATWAGVTQAAYLTISADGHRIALTKGSTQSDIYQLQLDPSGHGITAARQLTTDTASDWPSQWLPDGSAFLFYSDRSGALHGFRQPIADETPQPIVTGAAGARVPQMTADGRWIVYVEMSSDPDRARIMRVPAAGGPAEPILTVTTGLATAPVDWVGTLPGTAERGAHALPDLRCPPHAADGSCFVLQAVANGTPDKSMRGDLSLLDPATGKTRHLATLAETKAGDTFWDVSPDGTTAAFGQFDWGAGDRITLLRIATGERRVLQPANVKNLCDVAWAADGRSLFGSVLTIRGAALLNISLDGTEHPLRTIDAQGWQNPRPSPDGRSLLAALVVTNSNAWVIER